MTSCFCVQRRQFKIKSHTTVYNFKFYPCLTYLNMRNTFFSDYEFYDQSVNRKLIIFETLICYLSAPGRSYDRQNNILNKKVLSILLGTLI